MEHWNLSNEDSLFKTAYEQYRHYFSSGEIKPQFAPYGQIRSGAITPLELMTYYGFLTEHAQGVANEINNLYYRIAQLSAWRKVLEHYGETEKLILLLEFIDPIANMAIGLPFVMRSRFIYSISHLSHQANLILDPNWEESELPADKDINFKKMDKIATGQEGYSDFLKSFNQLNDDDFVSITRDYRNKNQHRFPPKFEVGHTEFIARNFKNEKGYTSYTMTSKEPLKLLDLQSHLIRQFDVAMECYKKYDKIICVQLTELHLRLKSADK